MVRLVVLVILAIIIIQHLVVEIPAGVDSHYSYQ